MKELYELRILGLTVFSFVVGALGFKLLGNNILLAIVPISLIWLCAYDLTEQDAKNTKKSR
ncbi:hypothetical protein CBF34_07175 [Vagococcus penaei]|nr:hypothetical protein CBF34_07175 [Vagococcus penaei]